MSPVLRGNRREDTVTPTSLRPSQKTEPRKNRNSSSLLSSLQGFQVLVETEWLDFGHKFADRCGHGENSDDLNERCPVFLQWLDCVHQLQRQFPCSFEFNEAFLVSGETAGLMHCC